MSDLFYQGPSYKDEVLFELKRLDDSKERNNSFMPRIFVENLSNMFNDTLLQGMYSDAMKIAKVSAPLKSGTITSMIPGQSVLLS